MSGARIPWVKVFMYYLSSEKVTYEDCAKKFKISAISVKEKGASEKWVQKKQEAFKAALVLMEQRSAELIAQRNEDHVALAKSLLVRAAEALRDDKIKLKTARDIKEFIEVGVKIERDALGMNQKVGPAVSITDPKGQTIKVTWGDGSSLEDY